MFSKSDLICSFYHFSFFDWENGNLRYFKRPEETKKAFDSEGWFKSGDIASRDENGVYRIWGRASSDIIKTGGYLVSALEIETYLREHPDVENCQVVGVPDPKWGSIIAALIILKQVN